MILALSVILFLLLIFVGKERGFKTFLTLFLNFVLISFYLIFTSIGLSSIILSIFTCVLASTITLFILNGVNVKTKSSFYSILVVLFLIYFLIYIIVSKSNIQGFAIDNIDNVGAYSFEIHYKMTSVFIGMYLICIIGTIIDTSISVSSSMNEVYLNNKDLDSHELFKSGMNVGKDILSTTISTLFFAIIASFIGFFMWHRGTPFELLLNYKVLSQDILQLLISFIGSILIIPITAYITSKEIVKI